MMKGIFYLYTLLFVNLSFAQQINISGAVKNDEGLILSGVSILLKSENKIKAFGRTDKEGKYIINVNSAVLKDAILETNHLSYQSQKADFVAGQTEYNFILALKENKIEEVSIGKAVPIKQKKDTLVYNVGAFADSMDRSIGDVLKRMPGFNVNESGKISYNGQDISHFFIDGDDILGSKYGLGTRNIPHDIITAVEVYRNHQAIKALENKVNSNQVAINLKVKDEARSNWIGEATIGGGLPKQYQIEFNTLMFNRRVKTINALQANNTGKNIESSTKDLTQINFEDKEDYWLSAGSVNASNTDESMYYNNNGIGGFFNLFKNIGRNWSFRNNIGLYIDKRHLSTYTAQRYDLPNIQQEINDTTSLVYKPLKLNIRINLMKNVKNMYLTNSSKFDFNLHKTNDRIISSELNLSEKINQQYFFLENNFSYIPNNTGNNILKFDWNTFYKHLPEVNNLISDTFLPALNNFGNYTNLKQDLNQQNFKSELNFDYSIDGSSSFRQSYGVKSFYEQKRLFSHLENSLLVDNNRITEFQNDMNWNRKYIGLYSSYQFNKRRLKSTFRIPIGLQSTAYVDRINYKDDSSNKILFNPSAFIGYYINSKQNISTEYSSNRNFGNIKDIYGSYILTNIRSIRKSNANIPDILTQNLTLNYNIENAGKMSFYKFSYSFLRNSGNMINNVTLRDGAIDMEYVNLNNTSVDHKFSIRASKFIKALSGTSFIEFKFNKNYADRIFNVEKHRIRTNNIDVSPRVHFKMSNIQANYFGNIQWSWTEKIAEELPVSGRMQQHNLSLTHSYNSKIFSTVSASYITAINNKREKNDQIMLNSSFRYKRNKNLEYSFNVSNILDQKNYSLLFTESGYSFYQETRMRGRMLIAQIQFSF